MPDLDTGAALSGLPWQHIEKPAHVCTQWSVLQASMQNGGPSVPSRWSKLQSAFFFFFFYFIVSRRFGPPPFSCRLKKECGSQVKAVDSVQFRLLFALILLGWANSMKQGGGGGHWGSPSSLISGWVALMPRVSRGRAPPPPPFRQLLMSGALQPPSGGWPTSRSVQMPRRASRRGIS